MIRQAKVIYYNHWMMKNTFKLIAVAANFYLLQLILSDSGGMMQANPFLWFAGSMLAQGLSNRGGPNTVTRDPAAEYESTIRTQLKYADQLLAADQRYTPQYADLELSNLERTLFGTSGQATGGAVPLAGTPGQASLNEFAQYGTTNAQEGLDYPAGLDKRGALPGGSYDWNRNLGRAPTASEYDARIAELSGKTIGYWPADIRSDIKDKGMTKEAAFAKHYGERPSDQVWSGGVAGVPSGAPTTAGAPGSGQAGILDLMSRAQPRIDEMTRKSTAYQRAGDVQDVEALGGRATAAFRESAGTTQLLDTLRTQAQEGLTGDILDPRLRREFAQASRAGQRDRGFGYGIRDVAEESAFTAMQADALRRQRQNFAQSVVGTLQATSVDPFMAILGRPGQAMAAGQGAFGQAAGVASGAGPSGMFGMNNYFSGVGDYNANAQNASNIAQYNSSSAMMGGMMQGGFGMMGQWGKGNIQQGRKPWDFGG